MTVALDKLASELQLHPPLLALLAPYEVETPSLTDEANIGQVKISLDNQGHAVLDRLSDTTRSLHLTRVAQTGYAAIATLDDPLTNHTSIGLWHWLLGSAALFTLAALTTQRRISKLET